MSGLPSLPRNATHNLRASNVTQKRTRLGLASETGTPSREVNEFTSRRGSVDLQAVERTV